MDDGSRLGIAVRTQVHEGEVTPLPLNPKFWYDVDDDDGDDEEDDDVVATMDLSPGSMSECVSESECDLVGRWVS